jgi:hypothetical protein
MMLRDSTDSARTLNGYPLQGTAASALPAPSRAADFLFTETDWASLTQILQISPASLSATFTPDALAPFLPPPGFHDPAWPSTDDVDGTPFFRLYDHGVCSVNIPWVAESGGRLQANSPFQAIQTLISRTGSIPHAGTEYKAGYLDGLVGYDVKVQTFDFGLYPHLKPGASVPTDPFLNISYPFVDYDSDDIVFTGSMSLHVDIGCGIDQTNSCDFTYNVKRVLGIHIDDARPFGQRVVLEDRGQNLDVTSQGCKGSGNFGFCLAPVGSFQSIVRGAVEGQFNAGLDQALSEELPQVFGAPFSLPVPTPNELQLWLRDTCQPDKGHVCFVPPMPDPHATNVGQAACPRRLFGVQPTVLHTGGDDLNNW